MSDIAVEIKGISKLYHIAHERERYRTLRGSIASVPRRLATRVRHPGISTTETAEMWALKDISFDIHKGEAIGVIGRNGAGKSTLLKILSRVTDPTEGSILLRGRVGSLLEVGTGFHPELTGRENIYLNGAIIGMRRAEIGRRFNEIVDFAEVSKFLDTPVKRYSSGMYVRLAFAVAAHLDCEILVVDEVLAVGDVAFQRKCLGKMNEVSKSGRTVVFVSHNVGLVGQLCERTVLLSGGQLAAMGPTQEVVTQYLSAGTEVGAERDLSLVTDRAGTGEVRFTKGSLSSGTGEPSSRFHIGDTIVLSLELSAQGPVPGARFTVSCVDDRGMPIFHFANIDGGCSMEQIRPNERLELRFDDCRLYPGEYHLSLWVGAASVDETYDQLDHCLHFEIEQGGSRVQRILARHAGTIFLTPSCSRL